MDPSGIHETADPADAGRGLDMLGAHFITHFIPQPQGSQE